MTQVQHGVEYVSASANTRFGDLVPEGRVKLVLRLHDLGEQSRLAFFVERGISAESATYSNIEHCWTKRKH